MFTLNCKGRLFSFDKPVVMGILNATPDSFYDGSRVYDGNRVYEGSGLSSNSRLSESNRFNEPGGLLALAQKMAADGAGIIDIGGQSTRPGSVRIETAEEIDRVIPAIESLHYNFPELLISVDTYHAKVAIAAVAAGASIVNDISGGMMDEEMIPAVAALSVPYICTHMQGTPGNMQINPVYDDVTRTVLDFFIERTAYCRKAGIRDLIIDPGFGFGKTIEHNFTLIKQLDLFRILELPLLLGVSRKGTIYRTLGTDASQALNGTTVLNTIGLMKGAAILRVHDVKEAVEAVKLVNLV